MDTLYEITLVLLCVYLVLGIAFYATILLSPTMREKSPKGFGGVWYAFKVVFLWLPLAISLRAFRK